MFFVQSIKKDARGLEPGACNGRMIPPGTSTMNDFNAKQGVLFYDYTLDVKQTSRIDRFLSLLDSSGVGGILSRTKQSSNMGRPEADPFQLFACILYGFALGDASLRELETSCRYDVRYMYIMDGRTPSHMAFGRFINKVIKPYRDEIFAAVTNAIREYFGLGFSECFVDGSKIEADANRYKFVWKPTRFHERLSEKARGLIASMGLERGVPVSGDIPSSVLAEKVTEADGLLESVTDERERRVLQDKVRSLMGYLGRSLEYEEKERICGPGRNSYYKTDHDATAMCLKQDYYSGLGSNMHAAYQVQLVVSSGIISSYYVSQDRADIYTFVPAMERFRSMYGFLPSKVCADSGYGCLENYRYCERHGIQAFVKYQSWQGECSGRTPALYELNGDGGITCLGGLKGWQVEIPGRNHRFKGAAFYLVQGCTGCAFMPYCRRFMKEGVADSRVFEFDPDYQRLKQKARDLLLSVEGIEMRVNRSCQSEGGFGVLKHDMLYDRFRRTGIDQVSTEFMLTALGYNIRKLLRYSEKGLKRTYWSAPEGTVPEVFRKPSAKRLANRVSKQHSKSVNETARNYRYRSSKR